MEKKITLRSFKKKRGKTIGDLAALFGVCTRTIDRWLSNPDKMPLWSHKFLENLVKCEGDKYD